MKYEVVHGSYFYKKEKPVFNDISFSIDEGKILAILGPNGAGKTTLLKCMLGFLKWKEGKAIFDGKDISTIPVNTFFQEVSYVPQSHTVTFPCTVFETVLLGRSPYLNIFSLPDKQDQQYAIEAMQLCGIEHLKEQNINEISGGELQLVYIARALCSNPKVLILDEAETGLDMANQIVVLDLLKRLSKEKGLMIIFNTHYPQHALDIADQTLLLSKEGTSLFGNTDQILTEENLSRVFHVPVIQLEKKMNGKTYHSLIAVSKNESI